MARPTHILVCRCAHASILPQPVIDGVRTALDQAGIEYVEVADLCGMAAMRDPRLVELSQTKGLRIAACYPRAVKWLFAMAGATLREDAHLLNLRTGEAGDVIAALLAGVETSAARQPSQPETPATGWNPWFPVIDFDRCTHCRQCLSFCLFDVYGVSPDKKVQVRNPANCKTDCPACSRVCPEMAIIFPKYKPGAIAGDVVRETDAKRGPVKVNISSLLGGDVYSALRNRRARFSADRTEAEAAEERLRRLEQLQKELDIPSEVIDALREGQSLFPRPR